MNKIEDCKLIQLPDTSSSRLSSSKCRNEYKNKEVETVKEKCKRVITKMELWKFTPDDLRCENQYLSFFEPEYRLQPNNTIIFVKTALQQINKKISGYKAQDIGKNVFSINNIIDLSGVLQKMNDCKLKCFYCRKPTMLLYENVREPLQWTLERIDNKYGHNADNVEIACLNCNLRRRTMYHERFVFTKNLNIVKMG